jgi:Bacterial SH3 domain
MTLMGKLMTGAGVLALSTGFAAAAPAVVQNDLNLRAGPGTDYEVIAAMPAGTTVNVMGCQASWCQVAFGGTTGFASRAYLGLGGATVGAAPIRGEGYAYGGYGPGYGYDEDSYAYGGYGPGYYRGSTYGGSYGYYEGERRFGNERGFDNGRSFNTERSFNNARSSTDYRSGDQNSLRSTRRSSATTSVGASAEAQTTPEIKGNNPMKAEKAEAPVANASRPSEISGNNPMKVGGAAAQENQQRGTAQAGRTRGNARETTGAGSR